MDPKLFSFIRRNYRRPLPELKLELMKQGFSSYQIEDALEKVRAGKRRVFFRWGVILLVVLVIIAITALVFIAFIRPAEELVSSEKDVSVVLPSERQDDLVEPAVEEQEIIPEPELIAEPEKVSVAEQNISPVLVSEFRLISSADALKQCSGFDNPDECLLFVAKDEYNSALCYEIGDTGLKNDCFFFFGQSDSSFCGQISSYNLRQSCEQLAFIWEGV